MKKAIFVSGFTGKLGNEKFDKLNAPFLKEDFNRKRIKKNSGDVIIFHGDNDPYVPVNESESLHKNLGGKLNIIPR